jgi:hypothetical protein
VIEWRSAGVRGTASTTTTRCWPRRDVSWGFDQVALRKKAADLVGLFEDLRDRTISGQRISLSLPYLMEQVKELKKLSGR